MNTYEVRFGLESGHTLNVLVAATSAIAARAEADKLLRESFRALGPSSVIAANWRFDEITVSQVEVRPNAHDFWLPSTDHPEHDTLIA